MKPVTHWRPSPPVLALGPAEVQLWLADLDAVGGEQLLTALSAEERARAARFHFERDRRRFSLGRAILRDILGRYLAVQPGQLLFEYTKYGRPFLATQSALHFNLSHAQGVFLLGVAHGREIGVDVEAVRPLPDAEAIAGRFFALGEQATLSSLPAAEREAAFFRCWTRKEAYIKALGSGLSQPLDEFEVSLRPGEPARLLQVKGKADESGRWRMVSLEPVAGYVAAIIAEGQDWELRTFRW